jgi:thiamine biosynthesis protein ThiI
VEIERIAKSIGTYDISIRPGLCCTIAPKKPSTYSKIADAMDEETKVDIEKLADEEFQGTVEVR